MIAKLKDLHDASPTHAQFKDWGELLLGQALLAEGSPLQAFAQVTVRFLVRRTAIYFAANHLASSNAPAIGERFLMKCPFCQHLESSVIDSRDSKECSISLNKASAVGRSYGDG